jgi:Helix-turn-helix domain of resolvase
MTAENMARRRAYRRNHPHPESPESRKKSNRKYRISSYGLTQEKFDRLLDEQQHTCGMCHEPYWPGRGNRILTTFPENLALDELGREQVLNVEDWAEIRRLRRAEQMPIAQIARVMGISRK